MTATASYPFDQLEAGQIFPHRFTPLAVAGATYYYGVAIALDSQGRGAKVTATTGLKMLGMYVGEQFTAVATDRIEVLAGVWERKNSASDPVTIADSGNIVYAESDDTIAKTSNGGTLSALGRLYWVNGKPYVQIGAFPVNDGSVSLTDALKKTVTVTHADLTETAANTSQAINIGTALPDNARIVGVDIRALTAFSGGGVSALTVDIGSSGDIDALIDGADLFAAAVDGGPATMPSGIRPNKTFASSTQLIATFLTDSGHDLEDLTAGSVTIDVLYIVKA